MTAELLKACQQLGGPARPTFCNVPPWGQALVYIAGLFAVAVFAFGIWRHLRSWRQGGAEVAARNLNHAVARVGLYVTKVLGQRATLARRYPGLFHLGIFWGFVLLFVGTALATLDWDIGHLLLSRRILIGTAYVAYKVILDSAGVILVIGLLLAIWRRYIRAPHYVLGTWDFVIWSLLFIAVTGFLIEALRLVIAPVAWGGASWMGQGVANLLYLAPAGFATGIAPRAHLWLWLIHMVVALLFVAAIPYTNAVHMLTTAANAVLGSVDASLPGAVLLPMDLATAEEFGASRLDDLNWKQLLAVDACTRCGRCETVCPAYLSGTSLNPKAVVVSLSQAVRDVAEDLGDSDAARGEFSGQPAGEVIVGEGCLVAPNTLWACTTCLACVEACPAFIEIVDTIVDMRRYLTLSEGALPGTSAAALRNMGTSGNPWGYAPEDRLAWAEGLDVQRAVPGQHYDVLYWVGCLASYDVRNQRIARAVVQTLRAARIELAVMPQERCLCDSARRLGEEYLFQTAAEENIANLNALTFDRIVCSCPHCYNVLGNEYRQFGGTYDVWHHSQLLAALLNDGRLPLRRGDGRRIAYHDSCFLGRYNGEYEAPRALVRAAGAELVELPRRRANGLCCGGGGGRMWFDHPEQRRGVEVYRLEEAVAASVAAIAVACPFCLTMLTTAIGSTGTQGLDVLDIAELTARSLDADRQGPSAEPGAGPVQDRPIAAPPRAPAHRSHDAKR